MKDRYERIPVETLLEPFDGAVVVLDHWWVIQDGCALLFQGCTWQCNRIKDIAERVGKRVHGDEVEIRHIPVAYTRNLLNGD